MKNGRVGFALVGTGMAGLFHAKELQHVRGGELVAVCSRDEGRVRSFAEAHGARYWYTDYRELLRNSEVDVVNVLVPTGQHAEVTIAASHAGKHALVEKPLEINLARADEMIRTTRHNGTKLGVIFQMRFGAVAANIKRALSAGGLGRILIADAVDKSSRTPVYYASAEWRGTRELEGGGCLMTQSIHIIDLLQHLVGPVRSVIGSVATQVHDIDVEDTATALLQFEGGAQGVIESTTAIKTALKSRLELHGERGTIVANPQYDQMLLWDVPGIEPRNMEPWSGYTDIDDPWAYPQTRHRIQLQDMVDAIRDDRDPVLTGEDARASLAINMAIYLSAKDGRSVSLEELRPSLVRRRGQEDA